MLANVTCPNCQHKYWLQEGEMGSKQTCPSCHCEFIAGKSTVEARAAAPPGAAAQAGYSKTMLADASPPIKYNCPRCGKPLEAASIEAGAKKNCPNCTQRHQVPAAAPSPAPAAAAGLNKTMLADGGAPAKPPIKYNCPNCNKPLEAPAEQAGKKMNCPHCQQRLQVPVAGLNKTKLAVEEGAAPASRSQAASSTDDPRRSAPATAGPAPAAANPWGPLTPRNVAIGVGALLALWITIAVVRGGPKVPDKEAEAKLQIELEKIRGDIELKKTEMAQKQKVELEQQRRYEAAVQRREDQRDAEIREHRLEMEKFQDQKLKAEAERQFKQDQLKKDDEARKKEQEFQEQMEKYKAELAESKRALDAATQKQQTIIQQPAPVVTYPWWHPRYYWW